MTVLESPEAPEPPVGGAVLAQPTTGAGVATAGLRLGRASGLGLGTAVLWLSLLVLLPLAAVVVQAFDDGWAGFWDAITTPQAEQTLKLTIISSLIVALINAVMGTLIAWVLVRDEFPGKRVLEFVIDIPFALPTIVAGLVLLSVYGTDSPVGITLLGTQRAIVLGLLFVTMPFVVRSVEPVLHALDRDTEQAAACLGASPWTTFRRVVLPLLLPAIASGAALAFARAVGEYGSVLLIAGGRSDAQVASTVIYAKIENFDFVSAASLATVLLVVSLVVIVLLDVLQGRWPAVVSTRSKLLQRVVVILYIGVLVMVPLYFVTYRTINDGWTAFWNAISSDDAVTAIRLTVEIALAATAINVVFGVGVALLMTRYRFWGRRWLGSLADLSVSVSPIVVGLALILVYGPLNGWFGKGLKDAGIDVIYALPGMILATAFVSMPLVLREIIPVLEEEGIDQEQAARVLGASAVQRFLRITLPIIRPALAYGIVLSLARSIGEFGAVKVVSGNVSGFGQTQTIPLVIDQRSEQFEPGAYQLAFVLILITIATIAVVSFRRKPSKKESHA